jgi:hypothetical protein
LATLAANVVLDVWLIPPLSERGAAIGSCMALLAGFVITSIFAEYFVCRCGWSSGCVGRACLF